MKNSILFGVGCYHFGLKKAIAPRMNGGDYIRELRKVLESIPNANNIKISASEDFETELVIEADEPISSMGDGVDFFPPSSSDLEFSFELYIPERIQKNLFPISPRISLPTENFLVQIRDAIHFSVTFIELLNPTEECNPSDAVVVVREFLERHFSEIKSELIEFESLGPSPFHSNFYLFDNKTRKSKSGALEYYGFDVVHIPNKGYDTINFYFDKKIYSDLEEAKDALFFQLSDELGLFYRAIHANALQIDHWESIEELLEELIERSKAKGIKAALEKFTQTDKQIQNLVVELSEFESNQIFNSFSIKSSYQNFMREGIKPCLDTQIKEAMENIPVYPTSQVREVITLLENRRSKTIDNFIVLISAVLGGIIGAILTLLVSS
jgi:hypothetical protein